ncbi:HNH endonuclease [Limimaricola cinnabarinus]|uniref:HNH endonuclease n=1 Tax=Limimaricola cinnabarinus TaxID=1125964 RepID=UPI0009DBE61E|nr:HNH endonuclease signature motif containing protein [Limimaricola cinnabarinus]
MTARAVQNLTVRRLTDPVFGQFPVPNGLTTAGKKLVLAAWGGVCAYCSDHPAQHVDHIIPKARGGIEDFGNYAAACRRCNHEKFKHLLRDDLLELVARSAQSKALQISHSVDKASPKVRRKKSLDVFHEKMRGYLEEKVVSIIFVGLSEEAIQASVMLDPRATNARNFKTGHSRMILEFRNKSLIHEINGFQYGGPVVLYNRFEYHYLVYAQSPSRGEGKGSFSAKYFDAVRAAQYSGLRMLEVDGDGDVFPDKPSLFRPLISIAASKFENDAVLAIRGEGWLER